MNSRKVIQGIFMPAFLFTALLAVNGQADPKPATPAKNAASASLGRDAKAVSRSRKAVRIASEHELVEKEILMELRQIRALLERQPQPQNQAAAAQPAPERARVSSAGYELGRKDAPITMVEFADYQCPFCRQFQSAVFSRIKKDYIDAGKVRFISRDLPLDFHSNAAAAALAARCAGEQDRYWQMRDALITHADKLAPEAVNAYATQLGLDMSRFQACMSKGTYMENIRADLAEANAAGIVSTPTFVIGRTEGNTVEGTKIPGAESFEEFARIFAQYVAQQKAEVQGPAQQHK